MATINGFRLINMGSGQWVGSAWAPIAVTGTANPTYTGATLHSTVSNNGAYTNAGFEYGLTTSYGTKKFITRIAALSGDNTPITTDLTGLTCNTAYHYRAYSQSDYGTGLGNDQSFTTKPCVGFISMNKIGSGTVTSNPAGIQCGNVCFASFKNDSFVSLTAAPLSGYSFVGWNGDCSGTSTCSTRAPSNGHTATILAKFSPILTVTKAGTGSGNISSNPSGIACGSTVNRCSTAFNEGSTVALSATAMTGSTFTGWSGACASSSRTHICHITMHGSKNVTATFNPL